MTTAAARDFRTNPVGAVLSCFEQGDGVGTFQRHADEPGVEFRSASLAEDDASNFARDAVDGLEVGAVLPHLFEGHAHEANVNIGRIVPEDDVGNVEHECLELLVGLFSHRFAWFAAAR